MLKAIDRHRHDKGQNLVEFALLFPFVLLFLGAIIMIALTLHARSNLQQAVREGARQAAVGKTLTEVQNLAAGNAPDTLDPEDVRWCHPTGAESNTRGHVGDPVTVYIWDENDGVPAPEGYDQTLVPASGSLFNSMGMDEFKIRMKPRATSRLEKSVNADDLETCP
jgi:hypothetical protein